MNIRPQEVTQGGERSVQYKGSDGKMHGISAGGIGGGNAQSQDVHLKDAFVIYRNNMANNARKMIADRFEQGFVRKCLYDFYDEILKPYV